MTVSTLPLAHTAILQDPVWAGMSPVTGLYARTPPPPHSLLYQPTAFSIYICYHLFFCSLSSLFVLDIITLFVRYHIISLSVPYYLSFSSLPYHHSFCSLLSLLDFFCALSHLFLFAIVSLCVRYQRWRPSCRPERSSAPTPDRWRGLEGQASRSLVSGAKPQSHTARFPHRALCHRVGHHGVNT